MKKTLTLLLAASGLLFAASCKKDAKKTTTTTPKTTGIVSCSVGGKTWTSAKGTDSFMIDGDIYYGMEATVEGDSLLSIISINPTGDTSAILITLSLKPGKTGNYSGTTNIDHGALYSPKLDFVTLLTQLASNTITYSVDINTFDAVNKKISGKFSITLTPNSGGAVLKVTDGEFNELKYTNI